MIIRSSNLEFFRARAAEAHADGEAATLDHVRDRCRRSEAAWQALAAKAERSERLRAEEVQRRAEASLEQSATVASVGPE
jgi:hypothetical protein